jgi:hypothetical protein
MAHDQIVTAIHPFAHYDVIGTIVSGPLRLWTLELASSPAVPHSQQDTLIYCDEYYWYSVVEIEYQAPRIQCNNTLNAYMM